MVATDTEWLVLVLTPVSFECWHIREWRRRERKSHIDENQEGTILLLNASTEKL